MATTAREKARQAAAQRRQETAQADQQTTDAADLLFDIEVTWPDGAPGSAAGAGEETVRYQVRESLLTWRQEKALYQIPELTVGELVRAVARGRVSPFLTACIVFLAELQTNGQAVFGDIADRLNYRVEIEWAPTGEVGDGLGEAPGDDSTGS